MKVPENDDDRFVTYKGSVYYIGSNGRPVSGWLKIGSGTYYFEKTGALNTTGLIGGKYYLLKEDYSVVKPLQAGIVDGYYCLNADGSIRTGWTSVKKFGITERYYTSKRIPRGGFLNTTYILYRIGGKYYAFDSSGAMRTGWQKGFKSYCDAETQEESESYSFLSSEWFYFDPKTGAMATGKKTVTIEHPESLKKGVFYFRTNLSDISYGAMIVGGIIRSGSRLVMIEYGQEVSLKDKPNGIYDESFCISKGKLVSGFKTDNGNKYYFDPATGLMVKNELRKISGKWYYFDSQGVMSSNLRGRVIDSDGTPGEEIISVNQQNGYISYFVFGNTKKSDMRVMIQGYTYVLDSKGLPATGPYTMKSGPEQGNTYLTETDGRLITKSHNTLVRYGKKHYLINSDGLLLKNGRYFAGSGWMDAFTRAEQFQIFWTSVDDWEVNKCIFYTDATGAVIKDKVITDADGNRIRINKYGLRGGPLYRQSGKWYWYKESGVMAPGRYKVEVKYEPSDAKEFAYITVGNNGQVTGGVSRSDGSDVQGFVLILGTDVAGHYYLDKKGFPSTGKKDTIFGKTTFNADSGIPDLLD